MNSIYDFSLENQQVGRLPFPTTKAEVLIVVNTATVVAWPRNWWLQDSYLRLQGKGTEIPDIPATTMGRHQERQKKSRFCSLTDHLPTIR